MDLFQQKLKVIWFDNDFFNSYTSILHKNDVNTAQIKQPFSHFTVISCLFIVNTYSRAQKEPHTKMQEEGKSKCWQQIMLYLRISAIF